MTMVVAKIAIIAGLAMPLSFGTAFAGGSDPSNTEPLSNQSDAALGESDCQAIWSLAVPDNDRLSYHKATPYVSDLQAPTPIATAISTRPSLWTPAKRGSYIAYLRIRLSPRAATSC